MHQQIPQELASDHRRGNASARHSPDYADIPAPHRGARMTYTPGPADFRLGGEPYTPPSPLLFNFAPDSGGEIIPAPPPSLIRGVGARWSRAAAPSAAPTCAAWGDATAKQVAAAAQWGTGA